MPPMKGKIKNLLKFIARAWSGGGRGKLGIVLMLFASFMFIGLFWGDVNIQRFVSNIFHLNAQQEHLLNERATLDKLQQHIELLQNYSSDYVEELGLKYLNIGAPDAKILKI